MKKLKYLLKWIPILWNSTPDYKGLFYLISIKQAEIASELYKGETTETNQNYKALMESSKKFHELAITNPDQKLLASATEYVRKYGLNWKINKNN